MDAPLDSTDSSPTRNAVSQHSAFVRHLLGALLATAVACSSGSPAHTDGVDALRDSGGTSGAGGAGGRFFDGSSQLAGLPAVGCTVAVTSSAVSPDIATVGIVSFTSNLPDLRAAEIHFGPSTDYGLVAPVDLEAEDGRTLLLGMAQNRTYHFRVAVSDGTSVCYGGDNTITTGSLGVTGLAKASTSASAAPGFIVTARDGEVVIFDKKGELVWAYAMWNVFSAQMSWDGKYMIARDPGPFDLGDTGIFYRVKMDGSDFRSMDAPGGDHHDFVAIPGGIAYIAKQKEGECDRIYEASIDITDGAPVFDTWQIYRYFSDQGDVEGTEICHANRIHYLLEKDLYTVSDRNKDAIAMFSRGGAPVLSIGASPTGTWTRHIQAERAGLGGAWHIQHGHHFYADDKLVVFSNESSGGAAALHYTLTGKHAALDWKYAGAGASNIQGDVERLPNGNFLVTANLSNTMVELGPDGKTELGRYVLKGPVGPLYGFTYATHRSSLYGRPASR